MIIISIALITPLYTMINWNIHEILNVHMCMCAGHSSFNFKYYDYHMNGIITTKIIDFFLSFLINEPKTQMKDEERENIQNKNIDTQDRLRYGTTLARMSTMVLSYALELRCRAHKCAIQTKNCLPFFLLLLMMIGDAVTHYLIFKFNLGIRRYVCMLHSSFHLSLL